MSGGEKLRDEGMQQVTEASDDIARRAVDQAIRAYAATGLPFSANLLRELLPDVRPALIGARFMAASVHGEIVPIGMVKSTEPRTRAHRILLWRGGQR